MVVIGNRADVDAARQDAIARRPALSATFWRPSAVRRFVTTEATRPLDVSHAPPVIRMPAWVGTTGGPSASGNPSMAIKRTSGMKVLDTSCATTPGNAGATATGPGAAMQAAIGKPPPRSRSAMRRRAPRRYCGRDSPAAACPASATVRESARLGRRTLRMPGPCPLRQIPGTVTAAASRDPTAVNAAPSTMAVALPSASPGPMSATAPATDHARDNHRFRECANHAIAAKLMISSSRIAGQDFSQPDRYGKARSPELLK